MCGKTRHESIICYDMTDVKRTLEPFGMKPCCSTMYMKFRMMFLAVSIISQASRPCRLDELKLDVCSRKGGE